MSLGTVELSAGRVEFADSGGKGPVIVFVHGLLMDSSLWDEVIAELSEEYRCVAPTLPLGGHRLPMEADADLSPRALARLLAEFLDQLSLERVTLVGVDTGGALVQLLIGEADARVERIVLVSCDAFDNFPPGLTGKALALAGFLPPSTFGLFMQQLRLKPIRRLPFVFGWLTKRGDEATARWIGPLLRQAEIRHDTVRVLRGIWAERGLLLEAAKRLPSFDRPALVLWAREDRVMPPQHGRRLAQLLPQGELEDVADSYTLIPLDQPAWLAQALAKFVPRSEPTGTTEGRLAGAG